MNRNCIRNFKRGPHLVQLFEKLEDLWGCISSGNINYFFLSRMNYFLFLPEKQQTRRWNLVLFRKQLILSLQPPTVLGSPKDQWFWMLLKDPKEPWCSTIHKTLQIMSHAHTWTLTEKCLDNLFHVVFSSDIVPALSPQPFVRMIREMIINYYSWF